MGTVPVLADPSGPTLRGWSLKGKILAILLGVTISYTLLDNVGIRVMVARRFDAMEADQAFADMQRVRALLADEAADVNELGAHLAEELQWLARNAPESIADHARALAAREVLRGTIDVFYLCDRGGRALHTRIVDPATGEEASRVANLPRDALGPERPLITLDRGQPLSGWMITGAGPLMVASREIEGASRERLIVGRFSSEARSAAWVERLQFPFEILALERELLGDAPDAVEAELRSHNGPVVAAVDGHTRIGLDLVQDVSSRGDLLVRASIPRTITAHGNSAVRYILLSSVAAALLMLIVLMRLLQRIVLNPIRELTHHASRIGRTDDTTARVTMERGDEIGVLATEFDRMMDKLARSRADLVETARMAGMSAVATGVLHNVGNVLNSVNVSSSLAMRHAETLPVQDLARLNEVLEQHEADLAAFVASDPRGKHLLPFLAELVQALEAQRGELVHELQELAKGVDHIAELVRAQQSYAGTKGVFEVGSLVEQVEASLKISAPPHGSADAVRIVRDYDELPAMRIDKHKLMEVLVNLVKNARQAMEEAGAAEKVLTVRVKRANERGARIEIHDSGVGIAPENLERIFHHGFTTKKSGHGFGLHVSANAATEMGGRLSVQSAGLGKGATFVLEIPAQVAEEALAA